MRELLFMLAGMAAASGLLCASALMERPVKKRREAPLPGKDVRVPGEETPEQRRMKEWTELMSYAGERRCGV